MFIKNIFLKNEYEFLSKFAKKNITACARKCEIPPIFFKKDEEKVFDNFAKKFATNNVETLEKRLNYKTPINSLNIYKDKCIKALKGSDKKELAFVIDEQSGKCITSSIGDAKSCVLDVDSMENINPRHTLILVHGHPEVGNSSKSLPISLQDFIALNNSKIKKIIAYNVKGEESFLYKNSSFIPLGKEQLKQLKYEYLKTILDKSTGENVNKIKELITYSQKNINATAVRAEIASRLTKLQEEDGASAIIDSFWREKAASLNLTYHSDFK
jgi:hypothetical protein